MGGVYNVMVFTLKKKVMLNVLLIKLIFVFFVYHFLSSFSFRYTPENRPILIRLAWHSAGTYDKSNGGKYGSNGATMRYEPENSDPNNAGLHDAMDFLEPIKQKYQWITYA